MNLATGSADMKSLPVLEAPPPRRSPMADHHLSARVWASAALIAALLPSDWRLGWWLPLHFLLIGAASQLIVGGQTMFSATLGVAPGPRRATTLAQLVLMNAGVIGISAGRLFQIVSLVAIGALSFLTAVVWSAIVVRSLWRRSLNRRFVETGVLYSLASVCVVLGAGMGVAMALGWTNDSASYASHVLAHMALNLWGWGGLTILGTMLTLLPTVLHVRAPAPKIGRGPWVAFAGLIITVTFLTLEAYVAAAVGAAMFASGLTRPLMYFRTVARRPRRRHLPTAGLHLGASVVWMMLVALIQVVFLVRADLVALRDVWVVGIALGVIGQALLGAWSFLLPSGRPALAEVRRRELYAFELGGKAQVAAFNLGLVALLLELRGLVPASMGAFGVVFVWSAGVWALLKCWSFPLLAKLPGMSARASRYWLPLDGRGIDAPPINVSQEDAS